MKYRSTEYQRTTPEVTAKWHELARTGSKKLRDELIVYFVPLANFHAARFVDRLPRHVCTDDAFSAAMVGLVKAVDSFDISRGHRFETYAPSRIRGAIIDDYRDMDWVPRLMRERTNKLARLRQRLARELDRQPTRDEMLGACGVSAGEFGRWEADAISAQRLVLSTHQEIADDGNPVLFADMIADETEAEPGAALEARDSVDAVLAVLPDRQRDILIELYLNGRQQDHVARDLERSPGRVSQWHTDAMSIIEASDIFHELGAAA